jgi:hypothetical protein
VGKETDRRWEQGEDLSLVEFKSFEYQQSKQVVAGEDIKEDILKIGIRSLERDTGVSHRTLNKILQGKPVSDVRSRQPRQWNVTQTSKDKTKVAIGTLYIQRSS